MPRRFSVIQHWIAGRREGMEQLPSVGELFHYLTQPSARQRAMRAVRSITEEGGCYAVALKDYQPVIYWPVSFGLDGLILILNEQFDPTDWHYYQIEETRVRPDDVALDCGAAEGLFTVIAASVCKRCYCVEPAPSFQPLLKKTFAGVGNVEILPYLLSDRIGETHIEDLGISSHQTENSNAPAVAVATVDSLFFQKNIPFTYLKADVEGAEMQLLEGARESIAQFRPRIAITTYHVPEHAAQIKAFLQGVNAGYRFRTKGVCREGHPVMLHAW